MRGKSAERGGPISPIGFHRLIQRLGEAAKMPFPIHPHMLRHACGFKLANDGHDTRANTTSATRTSSTGLDLVHCGRAPVTRRMNSKTNAVAFSGE